MAIKINISLFMIQQQSKNDLKAILFGENVKQ